MTVQLKLVRRMDLDPTADTELDLLDYTDGFTLARGGWVQNSPTGMSNDRLQEAMTLRVRGSSHDDMAACVQSLDEKVKQVSWYAESRVEAKSVWLRAQMHDESNYRDAVVTAIAGKPQYTLLEAPAHPGNMVYRYGLAMERGAWWEQPSAENLSVVYVNCAGGTAAYGTIAGDAPARIGRLVLSGHIVGNAKTEVWLGFRTDRFGTKENFQPTWQCEDGTVGTDASVSGGNVVVSFATTTTMATRVTVELQDATSNYKDQRGEFWVLLRAHVGSGTTCYARLQDAYSGAGTLNWRVQDRAKITATSPMLHAVGTVTIPPIARDYDNENAFKRFALRVQASRQSGSGYLYLDRLVLIPISEGAAYLDECALTSANFTSVRTSPLDDVRGWQYTATTPTKTIGVSPINWGLPVGAGRVVVAAQSASAHSTSDSLGMIISAIPRWRTLRGGE